MSTGNWSEPETSYARVAGKPVKPDVKTGSTIYPFNKVYESESGHLIEVDDTSGSERISINHRTGTFEEMHPNGDKVTKVVRDNYTSILRDQYVHIDGYCNVTIDKALKILVNNDKLPDSKNNNVNLDVEIGEGANVNFYLHRGQYNVVLKDGDLNVQVKNGDINLKQDMGNFNHFVGGDYNLEVVGNYHLVTGFNVVEEIGGCRDVRVDGLFDNLVVLKGYKETTVAGFYNIEATEKHELVLGTSHSWVLGARINETGGAVHETIGGAYFIGSSSMNITGGAVSISGGSVGLNGSGASLLLAGVANLSGASVLVSGATIQLNGPPAAIAPPAVPPALLPIYIPGPPGIWIPSINHERDPALALFNAIRAIKVVYTTAVQLSNVAAAAQNAAAGLATAASGVNGIGAGLNSASSATTIAGFTEGLKAVAQAAGTVAQGVAEVVNVATTVVDQVITVIDQTFAAAEALVDQVTEGLGAMFKEVINGIADALGDAGDFIGDVVEGINDFACSILDGISQIIGGALAKIGEFASEIGKIMNEITKAIQSVVDGIASTINKVVNLIDRTVQRVGRIVNKVTALIGNGIGVLMEGVSGILAGLGRSGDCGFNITTTAAAVLSATGVLDNI